MTKKNDLDDIIAGEGLSKVFCYAIYELTPAPWGDDYRFVKAFDTKEDAESVLKALEKVNIDFTLYKIVEHT